MTILEEIYNSVTVGKLKDAPNQVQQALEEGLDAVDILNNGLIAAMNEVGRRFEEGKYYIPEMLLAARTMQACVPLLKSKLLEADVKPVSKVVIGTVKGDLHDGFAYFKKGRKNMRHADRVAIITGGGNGIGQSTCEYMAQPLDVAQAVSFLASDEASFITGSTLNVAGGREMH